MEKLYKDKNGVVFSYANEAEMKKYGPVGLVPLSVEEIKKYFTEDVGLNLIEIQERAWRNKELIEADIEIFKLEDAGKDSESWREYRVKLRGYPQSEVFPKLSARPKTPNIKE